MSEKHRIYLVTFRCVGRRPLLADLKLGKIVAGEIHRVESLRDAGFYIINNPVRARLVKQWWDYPLLYVDSTIAAEAAPTELPGCHRE